MDGQNVVVVGATGVVGSGAVRAFLDAGARVIGVSRRAENLERLEEEASILASDSFVGVVGDFGSDVGASAAHHAIEDVLCGAAIDHVVTAQGFVQLAKGPTACSVDELVAALDDGVFTNFRAARALLPGMKARAGSSFTLVASGLAHGVPPAPGLWLGTMKNASLEALAEGLAAETAKDAVRVNCLCVHLTLAPIGGHESHFGTPADGETTRLGPVFRGIARGDQRGEVVCIGSWSDAARLAA